MTYHLTEVPSNYFVNRMDETTRAQCIVKSNLSPKDLSDLSDPRYYNDKKAINRVETILKELGVLKLFKAVQVFNKRLFEQEHHELHPSSANLMIVSDPMHGLTFCVNTGELEEDPEVLKALIKDKLENPVELPKH